MHGCPGNRRKKATTVVGRKATFQRSSEGACSETRRNKEAGSLARRATSLKRTRRVMLSLGQHRACSMDAGEGCYTGRLRIRARSLTPASVLPRLSVARRHTSSSPSGCAGRCRHHRQVPVICAPTVDTTSRQGHQPNVSIVILEARSDVVALGPCTRTLASTPARTCTRLPSFSAPRQRTQTSHAAASFATKTSVVQPTTLAVGRRISFNTAPKRVPSSPQSRR